jgi:hypothetical protein
MKNQNDEALWPLLCLLEAPESQRPLIPPHVITLHPRIWWKERSADLMNKISTFRTKSSTLLRTDYQDAYFESDMPSMVGH